MSAIVNDRDVLLQAAAVRFVMPSISPNRIPGLPGAFNDISQLKDDVEDLGDQINHLMNTSGLFYIRAPDLAFFGAAGTTTPSTITLTAERGGGLVGGTIAWTVFAGSATISPSSGDSTTVTGSTVTGRSVTIRARLTIDLVSYDAYATITRFGAVSAVDQVSLTTQVTGQLANSNVTGLGALALLNTVSLNSQVTGALNGLTQVTNLGNLAYVNGLAANQIGAGTLAAGVIYAGSINADNITSGTVTGRTVQTSAAGDRVLMSSSANNIQVWRGGEETVTIGGVGAQFISEISAVSGTNSYAIRGVGRASTYAGVLGTSSNGAHGVYGLAATGNGHGVAGQAGGAGSVISRGIVGHSGGYSFYAEAGAVNYGPFTGAHDALAHNSATGFEPGDIMIDVRLVASKGISDTLFEVAPSVNSDQKGAIGVCAKIIGPLSEHEPRALVARRDAAAIMCDAYLNIRDDYTYIAVNSLGEGQINVCGQNGNFEAGDLVVCSDVPGKGMRQMKGGQPDDVVRAHTVARVRADVTFDEPGEVKFVPCIYLCG